MTLNFPDNPSLNATYTAPSGSTYVWDGTKWNISNSLPPIGGAGADAWARIGSSGGINGSLNIASVTKSNTGTYDFVFDTPMPSNQYGVVATGAGNNSRIIRVQNLSTTGFTVQTRNTDNNLQDAGLSVVVHATDAILATPLTQDSLLFADGRTDSTGVQAFGAGIQLGNSGDTIEDYEEGTFDPLSGVTNLNGTTVKTAAYTKIGNLVHIDCRITWTSAVPTSGLAFSVPFVSSSSGTSSANTGQVFYAGNAVFSGGPISVHLPRNNSMVTFYTAGGGPFAGVQTNAVSGSYDWLFSFTYQTD